jgi:hypothetical protein
MRATELNNLVVKHFSFGTEVFHDCFLSALSSSPNIITSIYVTLYNLAVDKGLLNTYLIMVLRIMNFCTQWTLSSINWSISSLCL